MPTWSRARLAIAGAVCASLLFVWLSPSCQHRTDDTIVEQPTPTPASRGPELPSNARTVRTARVEARSLDSSDEPEIAILDMADGAPVPALRLWQKGKSTTTRSTDEDGRVLVASDMIADLEPESVYVRVPSQTTSEVLSSRTLYVYREMTLVVTIDGDGGLVTGDTASTVIETWICGGGPGKPAECEPAPWSFDWLKSHGINRKIASESRDLAQTITVTVPRIRGLTAVVRVPNWRPIVSRVAVSSTLEEAKLSVQLRAPNRIAGSVRYSDGAACAGAVVSIYCEQGIEYEGNTDNTDYEPLRALGHGISYVGGPGSGAHLTFRRSARTDDDGRYTADLNVDGAVLIEARSADGIFERVELGFLSESRSNVDITIPQRPKKVLSLRANGASLCKAAVLIADLSSSIGQPSWNQTSDERGSLLATGFVAGHRYFMRVVWKDGTVQREASGTLTWNDQESIDVERDVVPMK